MEYTDRPQPFFVIEGRRSADDGACRNIPMGSALGGHDDAIADIAMSGDAHLTGEDDILADDRGSCQSRLGA